MIKSVEQLPPRTVLAGTALVSALPIALVVAFPGQFNHVMAPSAYLVFHNIAEFFSIIVSLSIFGVGWYTFDQTKDRHWRPTGGACRKQATGSSSIIQP